MKARLSIALTALMTLGITATPAANFDEQDIEQTQVVVMVILSVSMAGILG